MEQVEWRLGVSVRAYREIEAGERWPSFEAWDRICELYGWPQAFVGRHIESQRDALRAASVKELNASGGRES
jgi:hypothetical protein